MRGVYIVGRWGLVFLSLATVTLFRLLWLGSAVIFVCIFDFLAGLVIGWLFLGLVILFRVLTFLVDDLALELVEESVSEKVFHKRHAGAEVDFSVIGLAFNLVI